MGYRFYGAEVATVPAISKEYGDIKDPREFYDILSKLWCRETCAPRMRDKWSPANKTLGQCSITAFLVQDIFGGDVYGIKLEDGGIHCYNVVDGALFDLTSEQFGTKKLVYAPKTDEIQLREVQFSKDEKLERYKHLKAGLLKYAKEHKS